MLRISSVLLLLLVPSCLSAADTGCIAGTVMNRNRPAADVEIAAEGSSFSAISDSSGRYAIPGLPPGTYRINATHSHYASLFSFILPDSVQVVAGDTTFADVYNLILVQGYERHYGRTIQLRISNPENRSLEGLLVKIPFYRLQTVQVDSALFSVQIMGLSNRLTWSLPWMGEQVLEFRDCPATRREPIDVTAFSGNAPYWSAVMPLFSNIDLTGYPLAVADSVLDEWVSDEYLLTHSVLDPLAFSDSFYENRTGAMGAGIDPSGAIRAVAATGGEILVLHQEQGVSRVPVGGTVEWCKLSRSANFALVCFSGEQPDPSRRRLRILNTLTGEFTPVEVFPDMTQEERAETLTQNGMIRITYPIFSIADNGTVTFFRGSQVRCMSLDGGEFLQTDIDESNELDQRFVKTGCSSVSGDWVMLYAFDSRILLAGDSESWSRIDIDSLQIDGYTEVSISPAGNFLTLTGRTGGLVLYSQKTGTFTELESEDRVSFMVFSADDTKLAYLSTDRSGLGTCRVFDLGAVPLLRYSFPTYSLVYQGSPRAVSSDGWLLVTLGSRDTARHALFSSSGKLVWVGHHLFGFGNDIPLLYDFSSTGDFCLFSDGFLLHRISFEEVD